MGLGARILQSDVFQSAVVLIASAYVRLCWSTTRWEMEGRDALDARLAEGPVILCLWHEHLLVSPVAWGRQFPMCTIAQNAHAGRLAGEVMKRLGLMNRHLDATVSNVAITREVMRLAKSGTSIGLAVDGPEGPRREASEVPVVWARGTGLPLWGFSYHVRGHRRVGSWDKMVIPFPFSRGKVVFATLDLDVPRKLAGGEQERLRRDVGRALNELADRAETLEP